MVALHMGINNSPVIGGERTASALVLLPLHMAGMIRRVATQRALEQTLLIQILFGFSSIRMALGFLIIHLTIKYD